jgi:hypothetical protein
MAREEKLFIPPLYELHFANGYMDIKTKNSKDESLRNITFMIILKEIISRLIQNNVKKY